MIIKKLLLFLFILINLFSYSQEIEGDWYGEMVLGARTAKLILSIGDDLEKLTITEKNPFTFELDSFYYYENEVVFYLNRINSKFVGKLDGEFIKGEWTQNGMVFPLVFSRDENSAAEELKRPQTPIPPFDYYTEELTIENQNSSISLSGTLTLPAKDKKQYPVVVLISGSGPQDRDSEMLGHKSFAVIADHLAKQGIGTFRYDERGVGKSTGKYVGSDLNDFYNDVDAIVNQLLERKEVKSLGLFGHSEGGIIAPRYASENKKKIDFVIMMGAPGVPIPELMHKQRRNQYEIAGMGEEAILANREMFDKIDVAVLNSTSQEEKVTAIKEITKEKYTKDGLSEMEVNSVTNQILVFVDRPWYNSFIVIEPQDYLRKIKCPVLAMGGGKDIQLDSESNLRGISEALNSKRFYKVDNTIVTFGSLNHLMQPAVTGNVAEYAKIETTIDRGVLFTISEWIKELK